jgi:hypothetical protein
MCADEIPASLHESGEEGLRVVFVDTSLLASTVADNLSLFAPTVPRTEDKGGARLRARACAIRSSA